MTTDDPPRHFIGTKVPMPSSRSTSILFARYSTAFRLQVLYRAMGESVFRVGLHVQYNLVSPFSGILRHFRRIERSLLDHFNKHCGLESIGGHANEFILRLLLAYAQRERRERQEVSILKGPPVCSSSHSELWYRPRRRETGRSLVSEVQCFQSSR